jgi:hypothetical protein
MPSVTAPALPVLSSSTASRGAPLERYVRGGVVALTLGAGAIHFAMAPDHFSEWWLFGVFFVTSAWLQIGLAAAVLLRPSTLLFKVGLVFSASIVVLWVVSRTSGLPVGPEHWTAEEIAPVDSLCAAFEIAAVIGFAVLLIPAARRRTVPREAASAVVGGITVLALGLTSYALTPSGLGAHGAEHHHTEADAAATQDTATETHTHEHGSASTGGATAAGVTTDGTVTIAGMSMPKLGGTGVLAGTAIAGCSMHHMTTAGHGPGACTDAPVTVAEMKAAESLVLTTRADLVNLPNLKSAYAAGYKDANVTGPLYHVTNDEYLTDGKTLDPKAVESLVYYKAPNGTSLLLGGMYVAEGNKDGPLVGGALTSWHSHTNLCINALTGTALNKRADGTCAPGSAVEPTGQMLHVWTVAYPGGPFGELDGPSLVTAISNAIKARGGFAGMS